MICVGLSFSKVSMSSHFLAINWMYRDEYRRGGFVMWANDDESGRRTSRLSLIFSVLATALAVMPPLTGLTHYWFLAPALLVNAWLLLLSWRFLKTPDRPHARKLFLFTLLYLPLMLAASILAWR